MNGDKTDNELMGEFKGCSVAAYNEIVSRYKIRLFNHVLRGYLPDRDESAEVIQKTLIRVFENKFTYQPKYQFSTWVYTIARNLAINEVKRKRFESLDGSQRDDNASSDPTAYQRTEELNRDQILSSALRNLDPAYREVLTMRYIEELSFGEISTITKKNINTLKSLARRGLQQMREALKESGIEEENL